MLYSSWRFQSPFFLNDSPHRRVHSKIFVVFGVSGMCRKRRRESRHFGRYLGALCKRRVWSISVTIGSTLEFVWLSKCSLNHAKISASDMPERYSRLFSFSISGYLLGYLI